MTHRNSQSALRAPPASGPTSRRFVEIVNWQKAQPGMPDRQAEWMKLYTSLLRCHQFLELTERSQMLVIALWLYAADSGRHVFPADPDWLKRRIPMLKHKPDLRPLLEAVDEYGEPAPFIRIVDKKGIYNVRNRQSKRENKNKNKSKTKPLRASEKKKEKKNRACARRQREQQQTRPDQTQRHSAQADPEQGQKPVQSVNPAKSGVGGQGLQASSPTQATPARPSPYPAGQNEPIRIGEVIGSIEHWYDLDAKAYSYEIFEALGLRRRGDPESQWGRSERGTFAKWLHSQPDRARAREHGLKVARNIGKGKGARKPGAVWLDAVNAKSRSPPISRIA